MTKKILKSSPIIFKRLNSKRSLAIETSLGLSQSMQQRLRTSMKNAKEDTEVGDDNAIFISPFPSVRNVRKEYEKNTESVVPEKFNIRM